MCFCWFLQDRDSQKTEWIDRCIEELRSDTWVLPALKQIKEICSLFYEVKQSTIIKDMIDYQS